MADYRYIAARPNGDVLHWDLPLKDVEFGPELSGSGSLHATLSPTFSRPVQDLLNAGDTVIYVERDSELLWGGIIWRAEPQAQELPIEASGFTSYLHRRHDLHGNLHGRGPYTDDDPCQVIRDVWEYAQEQPDGDLSVTVDGTKSDTTVGTAKDPYNIPRSDIRVLGEVVDDMVDQDQGLEWSETVSWRDDRARRHILLGAPHLGRHREDLTFTTGANVSAEPQVVENADEYAQWVIALGSGEGHKRNIVTEGHRSGRLRLEHRLETNEKDSTKLKQRAQRELAARQILPTVNELEILDHPAAPLTSLRVGDVVRIRLHEPHVTYDGWNRIVGWTVRPGQDDSPERITLKLERARKPEGEEGETTTGAGEKP